MGTYYLQVATSLLLLLRVSFCEVENDDLIDDKISSTESISSFRSEAWPHEMCNKTISEQDSRGRSEGDNHINYYPILYIYTYKLTMSYTIYQLFYSY